MTLTRLDKSVASGRRVHLEEAVRLLQEAATIRPPTEMIGPGTAAGRVAAEQVRATRAHPPFDRSPLDGYAVRHEDIRNASPETPVLLPVTQLLLAGDWPNPLDPHSAARIMTGAPIPPGADCVVRQEETDIGEEAVRIRTSLSRHDNIVFQGEFVKQGQPILEEGDVLDHASVALLAGQGLSRVTVHRRPHVAVLSTGAELAPPGGELGPAAIHDTNGPMLASRLVDLGAVVPALDCLPDEPVSIAQTIKERLLEDDAVITTGGVSVGLHDALPDAVRLLGARILFHGVEVMPGTPAMAAVLDGRVILSLSGSPFACFVTFELLAVPLLRRIAGRRNLLERTATLKLAQPFLKTSRLRRFVPAVARGDTVDFVGAVHTRALSSLVGTNCLVDLPAGSPAKAAGDDVRVVFLEKR